MRRRAEGANSATEPVVAARSAGLRYVNDDEPGIRRVKQGRGFRYIGPNGRLVRDEAELARIRRLAVPPAWTDVWICRDARGHIQATGRDAKRRKQYRYHAHWRQYRDETKFDRMLAFAAALPVLRRRAAASLAGPRLSRDKVLATIVQLLEKSLIRIGNEEYVRQNNSFGLTTLRNKHVRVRGGTLRFEFRGKSGVRHAVDVNDRRLATVVRQCRDLPGQELFQYVDRGGVVRRIGSSDINRYVREVTGQDFSAKDFRTWSGTVLAVTALRELRDAATKRQAEKNVVSAVEAVAGVLGNTRSVCRKSYVHPGVIDCYVDGSMMKVLTRASRQPKPISGLRPDEVAVVALLKHLQGREAKRAAA